MTLILSILINLSFTLNAQYSMQSVVPYNYSDFRTIQTEHFDVHYPSKSKEAFFVSSNMQEIAKKVSLYMEEAFLILTKDLNSSPYLRVQVVIVDNTDQHNGFATPVPQNMVYIYAVPPLSYTSIGEYDNWLRDTCIHEMTHIVNLSTTRGYSKILRGVFGTVVSVNGMSPLNLIEAYTVFEETNMSKKGRGRSTYLHTMLRTANYDGKLNSEGIYDLAKSPYVIDVWPLGNRPYLDGYLLMEHVALKYGMDVPGKVSKHNAGVVPYYPSYSFEQFTKKDIPQLWQEMLNTKNEMYGQWNANIKETPITPIKNIIEGGFTNREVSLSPSGKKMAFHRVSADEKAKLVIYDLDTDEKIVEVDSDDTSSISWIDEDTVLFNKSHDTVGSSYFWLYKYSISKKSLKRIKDSQRTLFVNSNNNNICSVRALTGQMIIEYNSNKIYTSPLLARVERPFCIEQDGNIFVFFIEKMPNEKEKLILLKDKEKITVHSSEGSIKDFDIYNNKLYFIDDKDKVFNIYQSELDGSNTEQITNLISGAFDIDVNDNGIYLTYYTSDGFRIGVINTRLKESNQKKYKVMELPIRDLPTVSPEKLQASSEQSSYSPFKTLIPKFWIPSFAFVDRGFIAGGLTYGADALFRHQYMLSGAYDSRTKKPFVSASYINQSFYPSYSIYATTDNIWMGEDEIIQDLMSGAGVSVPLGTHWSIGTGLTYHYRMMDFEQRRIKRSGLYGMIAYGDVSSTWSAISDPEKGLSGFLRYTSFPKAMDSTYSEYQIDTNVRFYIPLGTSHHVIAINNDLSYSYGDPYMFFLAGGEFTSLILGSKRYLMRGYPVSYFASRSMMVTNIEYRFPILTINGGHGLFPLFFKKIHGALISDNGFMGKDFKKNFHSGGIELRTDGYVLYHLPITLRLGLYKGTQYKKGQFFAGISSIF